MTGLFAFILSAVLALPIYKDDRAPELAFEKRAQLHLIAEAIYEATVKAAPWPGDKRELATLLIILGANESGFALRIGRGECKLTECDAIYFRQGRRISYAATRMGPFNVIFQAVSHWQLHERACSNGTAWRDASTDIRTAAHQAARAIVRARWACRSLEQSGTWVEGTISSYAGRGCVSNFKGRDRRVSGYRRLLAAPPVS